MNMVSLKGARNFIMQCQSYTNDPVKLLQLLECTFCRQRLWRLIPELRRNC